MCEYCGCQSVTAIGVLTREHDAVVDLIGQARSEFAAGEPVALAATARRIAAILEPHTAVEERALFPAMAGDFPEQIEDLVAEHRMIEAVLEPIARQTPADPGWPPALMAALDLLRRHILKEQDGVFPAALANLSTEQWEQLDAVRAEVAGQVDEPAGAARRNGAVGGKGAEGKQD